MSCSQLTLWSPDEAADNWTVRQSPRARRLSVRVYRTGHVEVIVPRRTSRRTVAEFLNQHREWIEQKRTQARRNAVPAEPFPPPQIALGACERTWRVHMAGGGTRIRVRELTPGLLGISGNFNDARTARRALQRWLMAKALEVLTPLLATIAREHGFVYRKIAIRRQRTRWGSCSVRGTISLNCSLLFQRPDVVRYLLIHELAHTQHMNHSKRFWDCVASRCRDYERLDKELRDGWRVVPGWVFER